MNRQIRLFSLFFVLTLTLVACGGDGNGQQSNVATSSESHPLFDMLKHAPISAVSGEIGYLDFRAVEDALPYVDKPAEGDVIYDDWTTYTMRWYGIPKNLTWNLIQTGESSLQTVGIEIRQMNRTLEFGTLPDVGTVWSGDFDEEAIRTAHIARGYSPVVINNNEEWCYAGDCTTGTEANPQAIEVGNIFDPQMGRKVPFLLWDNLMMSAPQHAILEEVTAPNAQTLYNSPNILSLAQAATAPEGLLVNWMVLPVADADTTIRRYTPEDIQPAISNGYAYQNLPVYRAVGIADRQEGDRMVCLIMLVYGDYATAESASAELSARLTNFTEYTLTRQTITRDEAGGFIFMDILGMAITHSVYTSPSTGLFVAVVRMAYDTPTSEQAHATLGSAESYAPDARAFRYIFTSAFLRRDFYPLWTIWNK